VGHHRAQQRGHRLGTVQIGVSHLRAHALNVHTTMVAKDSPLCQEAAPTSPARTWPDTDPLGKEEPLLCADGTVVYLRPVQAGPLPSVLQRLATP